MRKGRLGRGLEALLGDVDGGASLSYKVVSIESVRPRGGQPRLDAEQGIEELVESVKRHGVLQPIMVVRDGDGYLIVAGERRWLAAKKAGLKEVPVVVGNWDERDVAVLSIVENVQRKDLNPVEEALYYRRLSREFGLSQEEIASLTGKSRAHIANIMRVLRLPEEVCAALEKGVISLGHAKALLSIRDEGLLLDVFRKVVEEGLSVRDTEELVRSLRRRRSDTTVFSLEKYGLRVKLVHGSKTSKLVISGDRERIEQLLSDLKS